jgi:hypothetical protein
MVQSQPGQIVCETLSQKNPSQNKREESDGEAQGIGPAFKPQYHEENIILPGNGPY